MLLEKVTQDTVEYIVGMALLGVKLEMILMVKLVINLEMQLR